MFESFLHVQGGLRILMGPNGFNSPDEFIRADSSGSSPMSRFLDKMNEYLGGTAELDVFSIKVNSGTVFRVNPSFCWLITGTFN